MLGTAGHIDHGKTALIRTLTGIDCDRLPEEKARGITIELGFAYLELGDWRFGVVDVPGHERFVRSMVAGAGGIDLVMMVVAADEGVMPQTREHLDICELLAVPRGLIAVTKVDLVDQEWRGVVTQDVRCAIGGTFLEDAPIVPVSATTGEGIDNLKKALLEVAAQVPARHAEGLFRLPMDRVFTMKGFGTVVTGTLVSGRVRMGDEVRVLPAKLSAKVRGLEVHGQHVEEARAGQRTAINLQGVGKNEVARGDVLVGPDGIEPASVVNGMLRYLQVCRRPLKQRARVLFHTGTTQVSATCILLERNRLDAGSEAPVQFHLVEPIVVQPGDRFIIRGFEAVQNYGTTSGGGEIVSVHAEKVARAAPDVAVLVRAMREAPVERRVGMEVAASGVVGLARSQIVARLSTPPRELDGALASLSRKGTLVRYDGDRDAYVHGDTFAHLERRTVELVEQFHVEQPMRAGMAREELKSKLGTELPSRLFAEVVAKLQAANQLESDGDAIRRAGIRVAPAAEQLEPVKRAVTEQLRLGAGQPPGVSELALRTRVTETQVRDSLRLLVEDGSAIRIGDLYFDREFLSGLRARLMLHLESQGQVTPQQWKELCGASRKYSIPLAEHFDAQKVTVRVGEVRKLRR